MNLLWTAILLTLGLINTAAVGFLYLATARRAALIPSRILDLENQAIRIESRMKSVEQEWENTYEKLSKRASRVDRELRKDARQLEMPPGFQPQAETMTGEQVDQLLARRRRGMG